MLQDILHPTIVNNEAVQYNMKDVALVVEELQKAEQEVLLEYGGDVMRAQCIAKARVLGSMLQMIESVAYVLHGQLEAQTDEYIEQTHKQYVDVITSTHPELLTQYVYTGIRNRMKGQ